MKKNTPPTVEAATGEVADQPKDDHLQGKQNECIRGWFVWWPQTRQKLILGIFSLFPQASWKMLFSSNFAKIVLSRLFGSFWGVRFWPTIPLPTKPPFRDQANLQNLGVYKWGVLWEGILYFFWCFVQHQKIVKEGKENVSPQTPPSSMASSLESSGGKKIKDKETRIKCD